MFKVAIREWAVPLTRNPIEMVRNPATPRARQRPLTNGELEHLEAAAQERNRAAAKRLIGFAVETGMRKSEILSARWTDIDLRRQQEPQRLVIPLMKCAHHGRHGNRSPPWRMPDPAIRTDGTGLGRRG